MSGSSPYSAPAPLSASDERLWASLAHFGNILGFLPSLLIFLILGPRSTLVKEQSREALNFVITAAIAFAVVYVVGLVVGGIAGAAPNAVAVLFALISLLIGLVGFAVWVTYVVFSIIAGVRVNGGGVFRYPFSLRLVR